MSDALEIPCGSCGRTLRVPAEHAGKMARCPVCGHITQAPAAATGSVEPAPQAASPQAASSQGVSGESPASPLAPDTEWFMKTPEGQTFGPASFEDVERWVKEGRITADCQLCQGSAGNWQPADWRFPSLKLQPVLGPSPRAPRPASVYPPTPYALGSPPAPQSYGPATRYMTPHRGPLILVLGLIGLFIQCPVFPFMAWVMGSNDLREIESGRMDPAGRDITRAGMIVGMILSILWILGFLFLFGLMLLGMMSN